jgi:hypothetical protein
MPRKVSPPHSPSNKKETYSGGCQCGAVRFRVRREALGDPFVCHCRMCQKVSSCPGLTLIGIQTDIVHDAFHYTRGRPASFSSSNHCRRFFCSSCGTALGYDAYNGFGLCVLAFDEGATDPLLAPTSACGVESKPLWFDSILSLPQSRTEDWPLPAGMESNQHPDQDTMDWRPLQKQASTPVKQSTSEHPWSE